MLLAFVFIGILCLYKIRFSFLEKEKIGIYSDYMSLEKTTAIKGIFILIVFFSHILGYIELSDSLLNTTYNTINGLIGQSMVSMFMLYSGYGILLSIDKKGSSYVKSIPTKRFLKVLLHFDIAVIIYAVVQLILGNTYSIGEVLLAFTGWESVGNSNWYMFAILVLYILTYISFIFLKNNKNSKYIGTAITIILTVVFIIIMNKYKDVWWYDTLLCYPLGMVYYLVKDKVDEILSKYKMLYWIMLILALVCTAVFQKLSNINYSLFIIFKHIFFALSVVLITMKFSINNKILNFFGKHLFSIFILQRLPMTIFGHFGLNEYPILFVSICFVATIVIAIPFDLLMNKLDGVLFKTKKQIKSQA
ncbi:MAG: acyltransferase [Clostridiales bacterium]|nr:acyltransferase [Clostridiales bacterium]